MAGPLWFAAILSIAGVVYWTWRCPDLSWKLWKRSRTILAARLIWVPAAVLSLYDIAAPFLLSGHVEPLLPDWSLRYWPLAVFALGQIMEWMRKKTDRSVDSRKPEGATR